MAKNKFNSMKNILTSKQITNKLKIRIVKCYIYPTLLYGAETWTMNKQMEDKINALEMWDIQTYRTYLLDRDEDKQRSP